MGSITEICGKRGRKKQEIDVLSEFDSYMPRIIRQDRCETTTGKCYRGGCRPHAKERVVKLIINLRVVRQTQVLSGKLLTFN